jgi:hypothetical protein
VHGDNDANLFERIPDVQPTNFIDPQSDEDRYIHIEDDFMSGHSCDVYFDTKENLVKIIYNGKVRAVVKEDGHFNPSNNHRLDADFWGFDPPEDMALWTACILAEVALLKAKRTENQVFQTKNGF